MVADSDQSDRPPSINEYCYGTSKGAAACLLLVFGLFSLSVGFGAYHFKSFAGDAPAWLQYFLWLVSGVGALVVISPRTWEGRIDFKATPEGISFLSRKTSGSEPGWFKIPWEQVGIIEETRVDGSNGLSIELILTEVERTEYFPNLNVVNRLFRSNISKDGHLVVAFNNAFVDSRKAVKELERLRGLNVPTTF